MKYPNLRYGNPEQLRYYAASIPLPVLAKRLRRSERSVKDWLEGRAKVPWWVPEILRLQEYESWMTLRQMGVSKTAKRLGLVSADVIDYQDYERKKPTPQEAPATLQWPQLFG